MADKPRTSIDVKAPAAPAVPPSQPPADGAAPPAPPKRTPGHRGVDVRDTVAEMAARAQEISQEAGSKMAAAMKDVVSAAAGISGFALESARDLVQFMVRRGQMTQDEADKLMREAEAANSKRPAHPVQPPSKVKAANDAKAAALAAATAAATSAANAAANLAAKRPVLPPPVAKKVAVHAPAPKPKPKAGPKPAAQPKAKATPKAKPKPKLKAKPKPKKKAPAKRR